MLSGPEFTVFACAGCIEEVLLTYLELALSLKEQKSLIRRWWHVCSGMILQDSLCSRRSTRPKDMAEQCYSSSKASLPPCVGGTA